MEKAKTLITPRSANSKSKIVIILKLYDKTINIDKLRITSTNRERKFWRGI